MSKRGILICFCSINGAGKTTIINKLLEKFNNEETIFYSFKFPNRKTIIGNKIDKILKKEIIVDEMTKLKFFADNRQEFNNEITKLLKEGKNVILDRFVYCSLAYTMTNQIQQILKMENVNNEFCNLSFNKMLSYDKKLPKPDLTFVIDGNFLNLRNEEKQLYHNDDTTFQELIKNNYIISLQNTFSNYTVIKNNYGEEELKKTITKVFNHITKLLNNNDLLHSKINRF